MTTDQQPPIDENKLIAERRAKLDKLRSAGVAFPNDFRRDALADQLFTAYGERAPEWFDANIVRVKVGGRMMTKRVMGKASFAKINDRTGQLQLFVQAASIGAVYDEFKSWDVGDVLGAEGVLFKTKTGELSVRVEKLRLLVKSLRPLPDKWHGLSDQETRYRQRYVDLIISEDSRKVFQTRTRIIKYLRKLPRCARLSRSGNADDAGDRGRCCRQARSSRITTRSTWTCSCALRRSCI